MTKNELENGLIKLSKFSKWKARSPETMLDLKLIKKKLVIAKSLHLIKLKNHDEIFQKNMQAILKLLNEEIGIENCIKLIQSNLKARGKKSFSTKAINKKLLELAKFSLMELHLTDKCNLSCKGCFYSDKTNSCLDFRQIGLIKDFSIEEINFCGGGEPTLYNSEGKKIGDAIGKIKSFQKKMRFSLITNATVLPNGVQWNDFEWVRCSLDAANPKTYRRIKGKNLFASVIKNILAYLRGGSKSVGVVFHYCKANTDEINDFLRLMFGLGKKCSKKEFEKLFIIFKPWRTDSASIKAKDPTRFVAVPGQLNKARYELQKLGRNSPKEFLFFMQNQTNFSEIKPMESTTKKIKTCYVPLSFVLQRTNGNLYPCCVIANIHGKPIGTKFDDKREIALKLWLYVNNILNCNPTDCTHHENNLFVQKAI